MNLFMNRPIVPKSKPNTKKPKPKLTKTIKKNTPKQSSNTIRCCTWNIQHGLIKKELELTNLLESEKIDVIFLTETNTRAISKPEDYQIKGY